jgi:hypothetical protein
MNIGIADLRIDIVVLGEEFVVQHQRATETVGIEATILQEGRYFASECYRQG